jgi:hypothetical protein
MIGEIGDVVCAVTHQEWVEKCQFHTRTDRLTVFDSAAAMRPSSLLIA